MMTDVCVSLDASIIREIRLRIAAGSSALPMPNREESGGQFSWGSLNLVLRAAATSRGAS